MSMSVDSKLFIEKKNVIWKVYMTECVISTNTDATNIFKCNII